MTGQNGLATSNKNSKQT